jgi:lipopolysaccharide transport system permease protein
LIIKQGNVAKTEPRELVIEAGKAERHYWLDLWRYRELFYFLAWRDLLVRYKQTAIGVLWALIRPIVTILVFSVVFGKLAGLPSHGVPYPVLVCAAILPWQLFSSALSEAGNSLVTNANLISKIYFPRIIVPLSSIVVSLADFLISSVILFGLVVWYGIALDWRVFMLPLFALMTVLTATSAALWIAALNVTYRDFRFLIPFMIQLGLYLSPVGFSSAIVPERWRLLYSTNPMVGVIDGFRWSLGASDSSLYWPGLCLSAVVVTCLLVSGIFFFRRTERTFADVI